MSEQKPEKTIIGSVASIVHTSTSFILQVLNIALLEARLAGVSLATILGMMLFSLILVLSIWLSAQALIAVELSILGFSFIQILFTIMLLNMLLLIPIYRFIRSLLKNVTFSATRQQLTAKTAVAQQKE